MFRLSNNLIRFTAYFQTPCNWNNTEGTIIITPFSDAAAEGQESIIFEFDAIDYGCIQYTPDLIVFDLVDQPDLNFTLTEDFSISCPGDDAECRGSLQGVERRRSQLR